MSAQHPHNCVSNACLQGTSRGGANIKEIVRRIDLWGLDMVFVVGGNGGNAAADAIQREVEKQGVRCVVAGVPKSIDNDILLVSQLSWPMIHAAVCNRAFIVPPPMLIPLRSVAHCKAPAASGSVDQPPRAGAVRGAWFGCCVLRMQWRGGRQRQQAVQQVLNAVCQCGCTLSQKKGTLARLTEITGLAAPVYPQHRALSDAPLCS
jgi:hypothetical protein